MKDTHTGIISIVVGRVSLSEGSIPPKKDHLVAILCTEVVLISEDPSLEFLTFLEISECPESANKEHSERRQTKLLHSI